MSELYRHAIGGLTVAGKRVLLPRKPRRRTFQTGPAPHVVELVGLAHRGRVEGDTDAGKGHPHNQQGRGERDRRALTSIIRGGTMFLPVFEPEARAIDAQRALAEVGLLFASDRRGCLIVVRDTDQHELVDEQVKPQ